MKDAFLDCEAALTDWQENTDSFDEASFKIDRTNSKLENIIKTNIVSGTYRGQKTILKLSGNSIDPHYYQQYIIINLSKKIFFKVIEKEYSAYADFLARYKMAFLFPGSTAIIWTCIGVKLKLILALLSFIYFIPRLNLLGACCNFISLTQTLFKSFLLVATCKKLSEDNYNIPSILPIYTIIVPLYREAGKVTSIVKCLKALDYPRDKLDIKIVVEQEDRQTIQAIKLQNLDDSFHILVAPPSRPKTKPKACNYALNFAIGEYIVIYDAEDRPDKDQIIKAVSAFEALDKKYACLQARLKIDNFSGSLLGDLFRIEYDVWFNLLLTGLESLGLPITLGGTSNHFKTDILRDVGGWDAYNVTEDAELGIRLNLLGYKVSILDSETREDPPISLLAWIKQRIRWIKGFFVTIVTYFLSDRSRQNIIHQISILIFVVLATMNFLTFPFLVYEIVDKGFSSLSSFSMSLYLIFNWCSGMCSVYLCKNQDKSCSYISIILFPFYFALHSLAAYYALCELILAPHRWNKSDHNMS